MTERFDMLEAKLDSKTDKTQVDQLMTTVDGIVNKLGAIETELTMRSHHVGTRLGRHEGWIKQLADHSSVRLDLQEG
jgi:hypothetical protein